MSKEHQLMKLLELKYQTSQTRAASARVRYEKIIEQIEEIKTRRNVQPCDPADQLNYERHIGWLDQRGRELSIQAAQAAADFNVAKEDLRVQFGRKAAFSKGLAARVADQKKRKDRQLS